MDKIHAELPLKAAAAYEQVAKRIANDLYSRKRRKFFSTAASETEQDK
ncbi:MAG: hypothetical protein IJI04_07460 [Lachnospiraceae bacterium]|nr:hypothetical protein [Lachnospiraceae bacterium]